MVDPSSQFAGASTGAEATSRRGVGQYRRTWTADNPRANVLLLHGVAEHSGRYEHVGAALVDAGFSVRAYDHHGHGRSGGKRGHVPSFDVFLEDVEDNLAELREEGLPVVLLGHSMGGLIGFSYSVSGRPLPDVLLLSGPALDAVVPKWQRVAAPVIGRIAPKLFIKSELDGALLSTDPDVGAAYHGDPLRVPGQTVGLGRAIFTAMDTANERLDRLSIPTMVVHGGDDPIVPARCSEPIGALAVGRRTELPGLKHEVLNEPNWESTLQSLIDFTNNALESSS
jgi:acylglycerol lipase